MAVVKCDRQCATVQLIFGYLLVLVLLLYEKKIFFYYMGHENISTKCVYAL